MDALSKESKEPEDIFSYINSNEYLVLKTDEPNKFVLITKNDTKKEATDDNLIKEKKFTWLPETKQFELEYLPEEKRRYNTIQNLEEQFRIERKETQTILSEAEAEEYTADKVNEELLKFLMLSQTEGKIISVKSLLLPNPTAPNFTLFFDEDEVLTKLELTTDDYKSTVQFGEDTYYSFKEFEEKFDPEDLSENPGELTDADNEQAENLKTSCAAEGFVNYEKEYNKKSM